MQKSKTPVAGAAGKPTGFLDTAEEQAALQKLTNPDGVGPAGPGGQITQTLAYQPLGGEPRKKVLRADPITEYVAGGIGTGWTYSPFYLRSLPFYIDDLSEEFGEDIYDRMLLDGKIFSSIEGLKLEALENGLILLPAISDEKDPAYRKAMEIRDWCQRVIDAMDTPLLESLKDMLDAMAVGNKVAEMVLGVPSRGQLANSLALRYLKPKPRRSIAYVVDAMLNVRGLLGLIPGMFSPMLVDNLLYNPDAPNLLPRRKFAVLTYNKRDGDPRGTSLLRAAYNAWWLKQQNYPSYLKYLASFAIPSVVGTTAPEAGEETVYDENGEPVYNDDGSIKTLTPQQAMTAALMQLQNASVMAFPNGADVKPLEVKDGQSPYEAFIDARNREISEIITGQTLAGMEGQRGNGSRSASETHQDEKSRRVNWARISVSAMLRSDVLRELVRLNFGEDVADDLTPIPSLVAPESADFAEMASAIGGLWKSAYPSPSQLAVLDQKLGLPARTKEELSAITDRALAPPPIPSTDAPPSKDDGDSGKGNGDSAGFGAGDDLLAARARTNSEPTDAQKAAGNYSKGRLRLHGLDIAIETPAGAYRSGRDRDGRLWKQQLAHDYGYFPRQGGSGSAAIGADGDPLDVFVGPSLEEPMIYVIDQVNAQGEFDEHKCIVGARDVDHAKAVYLANYPAGWRCGPVVSMNPENFLLWMRSGDTKTPQSQPEGDPATREIVDTQGGETPGTDSVQADELAEQ